MSYGIQFQTSLGDRNILQANSARMLRRIHATSNTGQVSLPNWSDSKGEIIFINNTDRTRWPAFEWNDSTKVFRWWNHNSGINVNSVVNNFYILLVEVF